MDISIELKGGHYHRVTTCDSQSVDYKLPLWYRSGGFLGVSSRETNYHGISAPFAEAPPDKRAYGSEFVRLFSRFAQGEPRLNRIETFTDGVSAIIVTLLILDLKVPVLHDERSASELARRLTGLLPQFQIWLTRFVIVCKFWLNHHHIFSLVRHANYSLVWLNVIFLMCQSFIPFPTALMGEHASNPLAVSFFGYVMAINTITFIAMHRYILQHLIKPELSGLQDPLIILNSFIGVISYLIGAACAWISVDAAFGVYALTRLFFIVPPQGPQVKS